MKEIEDAFQWAEIYVQAKEVKVLTKRPWAKTLKLITPENKALYLKLLPSSKSGHVAFTQMLSEICVDQVPRVIATDPGQGFLLLADHEGVELGKKPSPEEKSLCLQSYAQLQAKAHESHVLCHALPTVEMPELLNEFFEFLQSEEQDGNVSAAWFLGKKEATAYFKVLSSVRHVMADFIFRANSLPIVVSHGDFRSANMAIKADQKPVFFDWDDAVCGPAGFSLHAQFSGCCRPYIAIHNKQQSEQSNKDRALLDSYVSALAAEGLGDKDELEQALPASIFAGVLHYLLSYSSYPGDSDSYRNTVRKIFQRRLSDIMNLCQWLVQSDDSAKQALIDAYLQTGRKKRAQSLVGITRSQREIRLFLRESEKDGVLPTLTLSEQELESGLLDSSSIELGSELFARHGTLLIENAIPTPLLNSCHENTLERYGAYFNGSKPSDALRVGDKRYMVTLSFEAPFNNPALYASPFVLPILKRLLGKDLILGSFTTVASLPGSKLQRLHKDHPSIFPETSTPTPSFAITLIVPMISLDEVTGATRLVKGSHLRSSQEAKMMPAVEPMVPLGSCFLMDYRLSHQGAPNRSDQVRPILSLVYHRNWFRDIENYKKQKPLDISESELAAIPKPYKSLFDWVNA